MATRKENGITEDKVKQYELLSPLLSSISQEMKDLSKKKPDALINSYKLKMVNRILEPLKDLLKSESSNQYLDVLSDDELPSNSDVVFVLSQYSAALDVFYKKYYIYDEKKYTTTWNIK